MSIYDTSLWDDARAAALERDGHRCTVARWLGGACSPGPLQVHHLHAVAEGGAPFDLDNLGTACQGHHPMWESLRRLLVRRMLAQQEPVVCRHRHVSVEARRICEARMARERERLIAA